MKIIKKLKQDGTLYILAVTLFIMFLGGVVGSLYATYTVLHNEQTESGRYAVYKKCIRYVSIDDGEGGSGKCVEYDSVAVPLGQRLIQQIKHHIYLGAGYVLGPALLGAWMLWNAKEKKKLRKE